MPPEEPGDFTRLVFEQWKTERREIVAYNVTVNIIKSENPHMGKALDTLLENAWNSEDVRKFAASRFEGFEELIDTIGEGTLEKLVQEFQERVGSKFPTN
jgi:hypothetical protein